MQNPIDLILANNSPADVLDALLSGDESALTEGKKLRALAKVAALAGTGYGIYKVGQSKGHTAGIEKGQEDGAKVGYEAGKLDGHAVGRKEGEEAALKATANARNKANPVPKDVKEFRRQVANLHAASGTHIKQHARVGK